MSRTADSLEGNTRHVMNTVVKDTFTQFTITFKM